MNARTSSVLQVQQLHTADIPSEAYLLPIPKEHKLCSLPNEKKMARGNAGSDERLPSDGHAQ